MNAAHSSHRWPTSAAVLAVVLAATIGYFTGKFAREIFPPADKQITAITSAHKARPSRPAPDSATAGWDSRWRQASSAASGPTRTRALAKLLEELARTQPQRALDLAFAEANWHAREELRNAALRGWGATAPDAAVDWAMKHRLGLRMACMEAVLAGAAENPAAAVSVALRACATESEPAAAADYGHALIAALVENSAAFDAAADFAAKVGTNQQTFLADSAFYRWAQHQPQKALEGLAKISDPKIRGACLDGLLQGWADADAKALATYAQNTLTGEERTRAFAKALPHWVSKDPATAVEWIGQLEPSPELDAGFMAVAELPSFSQKGEIALEWANNVTDKAKRIFTKHAVFSQWAQHDFDKAQRFAQSVKDPDEREMMLEVLKGMKSDG